MLKKTLICSLICSAFIGLSGCSTKTEIVKNKPNYQQTYEHANKAWQELDKQK